MLPKLLHYCWFGNSKKSQVIINYMKSWRKYCADFQIIEWNEKNFDINCCDYIKEAYDNQKWAFVSDYVRYKVLSQYGGIYLDVDVEIIKPIDKLLENAFCGFETSKSVNSGLIIGCEPGNWLCNEMLKQYENDHFVNEDDSLNLTTVCERATKILVDNGLLLEDRTQNVKGITIYSTNYFNPYDVDTGKITLKPETYSIHHYSASWVSTSTKIKIKFYRFITRIFGKKNIDKVKRLIKHK